MTTESNEEITEDVLVAKLANLQSMLTSLTEKIEPFEQARIELDKEKRVARQQYEERMAALAAKDTELSELVLEAKREIRTITRDVESTQRQYQQAKKLREQVEAFSKISD